MQNELEYPGVSVIIAQRECIQTALKRKRKAKVYLIVAKYKGET